MDFQKTLYGPLNVTLNDRGIKQRLLDWGPYFRYYDRQCREALVDRGRFVAAKSHYDIFSLTRCFNKGATREMIKEDLRSKFPISGNSNEDERVDGAIDLAARLYLMVNIAVDTRTISEQIHLGWTTGSLKECVHAHFKEPQILSDAGIRMEPIFTAANIENVAGLRVISTDNLADHLRLMDRDGTVAVFCNVSFLRRHVSDAFPEGLAAETLKTLSLLFPPNDKDTQHWIRKRINSEAIDRAVASCALLRLEERQFERFNFWHDRLVILKQAFDQSRPSTIAQWWHDRRNGVQWYTFWVAILVLFLTIFFGLVQSIEGALQVYKAFHPS
ncbi:uncharacterized protein M421DRAFT_101737 [Didymella exigua CBS 183.55]|uniref:Uncharacterized protein n=1 Tax=Didymella exigua CBS 183.55 TaxID=1150837 RepID=A0A6A5RLS1_9PLEO|nr:uncharacterized protein M421DRAFT_101737 [Didymella exigua CBS 183.55]KAF1927306.1 hypothetical protein M421DRAFT_101737 [Didymella exigua CBS 183.55]